MECMSPMRVSTPLTISTHSFPNATTGYANIFNKAMTDKQIDKIAQICTRIDAIASLYCANSNKQKVVDSVIAQANSIKNTIDVLLKNKTAVQIINEFDSFCKAAILDFTNESIELVNSIDNALIINALQKQYAKQLSAEQITKINDILIKSQYNLSNGDAMNILLTLGYINITTQMIAALQEFVQYEVQMQSKPVNESMQAKEFTAQFKLLRDDVVANRAISKVPQRILQLGSQYRSWFTKSTTNPPIANVFTPSNAEAACNDIFELCKRQRTSNAMIASEYVKELKDKFDDWLATTKYGSKYGTYSYKSEQQQFVEAQQANYTQTVNDLTALVHSLAAMHHTAAGITTRKNLQGNDMLIVKLTSNFMQADMSIYSQFKSLIEKCNFYVYLRDYMSTATVLAIVLDKAEIIAGKCITTSSQAYNAIVQKVKKYLAAYNMIDDESISTACKAFINMQPHWLYALNDIDDMQLFVSQALWNALTEQSKLLVLINLHAQELNMVDGEELTWNSLSVETKQAFLSKIIYK